jgi:hypothetical protein
MSAERSRRSRRLLIEARWNQSSLTSGELAREYGFTDIDGSRPDIWRCINEVRDNGMQRNRDNYR